MLLSHEAILYNTAAFIAKMVYQLLLISRSVYILKKKKKQGTSWVLQFINCAVIILTQ